MNAEGRVLKMVVVGDGQIGKTCLLISFTQGAFKEDYVPTVFDNYAGQMTVDGSEYTYTLWDTAGQEGYDKCRVLSYPLTNVFLVCFSVAQRASYENVRFLWVPEVRKECGEKIPAILVGTKSDLRPESGGGESFVSRAEGKKLARTLSMEGYVECSAKQMTGLSEVFQTAIRAAVKPFKKNTTTTGRAFCVLL